MRHNFKNYGRPIQMTHKELDSSTSGITKAESENNWSDIALNNKMDDKSDIRFLSFKHFSPWALCRPMGLGWVEWQWPFPMVWGAGWSILRAIGLEVFSISLWYRPDSTLLPLTEKFIERYADRWHWYLLSRNENIVWTAVFIERFADKWRWKLLSSNTSLPWTEDLVDRYADKWYLDGLDRNTSLPWSEAFIDRYSDRWNWGQCFLSCNTFSTNESLPWTEDFI